MFKDIYSLIETLLSQLEGFSVVSKKVYDSESVNNVIVLFDSDIAFENEYERVTIKASYRKNSDGNTPTLSEAREVALSVYRIFENNPLSMQTDRQIALSRIENIAIDNNAMDGIGFYELTFTLFIQYSL